MQSENFEYPIQRRGSLRSIMLSGPVISSRSRRAHFLVHSDLRIVTLPLGLYANIDLNREKKASSFLPNLYHVLLPP